MGAGLAIQTIAALGKADAQIKAADLQMESLKLEGSQKTIETQQKTLRNYDQIKKIVDTQTANAGALGYMSNSQSFNAIQLDTLRTGARAQENIITEGNIAQLSIENEKRSVKNTLFAQLFGDAVDLAAGATGTTKSAGSTTGSNP